MGFYCHFYFYYYLIIYPPPNMKYFKIEKVREKYFDDEKILQYTKKGIEAFFFCKFKYSFKIEIQNETKVYRCTENFCKAKILIIINETVSSNDHKHNEIKVEVYM
ncbi:hypothetical protein DMUE_2407 [Dictyocoela muelleri]|nr:hypothetical protein DMUE_2407 [Dictyocoela muelleri]